MSEFVTVLRELRNVNNYDQNYLDLLPKSCIHKSAALLKHIKQSNGIQVKDDAVAVGI